jgi:nucleotide-binding universal stress UspA family protein
VRSVHQGYNPAMSTADSASSQTARTQTASTQTAATETAATETAADIASDPEPASSPSLVVGVDGSPPSRAALRWAIDQAGGQRRVLAVAVWQELVQFGPVPVFPSEEFEMRAREWMDEALEELPDSSLVGNVSAEVASGDPASVLVELAEGADLLVLGNRGRSALASALVGSVALRCAHHATCPVVLVPGPDDDQDPPRTGPSGGLDR